MGGGSCGGGGCPIVVFLENNTFSFHVFFAFYTGAWLRRGGKGYRVFRHWVRVRLGV